MNLSKRKFKGQGQATKIKIPTMELTHKTA